MAKNDNTVEAVSAPAAPTGGVLDEKTPYNPVEHESDAPLDHTVEA